MKGFENLTEEPKVPYKWNAVFFFFFPLMNSCSLTGFDFMKTQTTK